MAETSEQDQENHQPDQPEVREGDPAGTVIMPDVDDTEKKKLQPSNEGSPAMTFTIWPPSQRTRDAVINRLVETLAKESILSKRYGTVPHDEAVTLARQIEEEAFSAAASSPPAPADAPGADDMEIGTLQMYSREISKRMLSTIKNRAPATPTSPTSASTVEVSPTSSAAAPADIDEAPSAESETSQA